MLIVKGFNQILQSIEMDGVSYQLIIKPIFLNFAFCRCPCLIKRAYSPEEFI